MVFTKRYSDELSVNESEKRIMFPIKTHGVLRIRGKKGRLANAKHFKAL